MQDNTSQESFLQVLVVDTDITRPRVDSNHSFGFCAAPSFGGHTKPMPCPSGFEMAQGVTHTSCLGVRLRIVTGPEGMSRYTVDRGSAIAGLGVEANSF